MAFHLPSLSELRNTEFEIFKFQTRVMVMQGAVLLCFALLGMRLFYLQVIRHDDLLAQAENNRTAILPTVPNRGTILDRNGVVLANNYSAYTLEITPSRVKDVEATIDRLSEIIDIPLRDRRRFKRMREESKNFDSLPIRSRLTDEEVAKFTAQQFQFRASKSRPDCFATIPLVIWAAT
jgi:penicillin-binding protein 2